MEKVTKLSRKELSDLIYFFNQGIEREKYWNPKRIKESVENRLNKIREKLYQMKNEQKSE